MNVAGLQRAAHLLELRRFEQAQAELAALVAENPGDADASRLMVVACLGRGQVDAALEWARYGLASAPDDPLLHLVHSQALCESGSYRPASRAAAEAIRLQPDAAAAHQCLAYSLAHRVGHHARALRAAHEGLRLAPDDSASWHAVGYVLHSKDRAGARAAYEQALAIDPTNALSQLNLATVDVRRTPFAALDTVTTVLASDPTSPHARRALTGSLDALIRILFVIALLGLQVLGHAEIPYKGWVLLGWGAVIMGLAVIAYIRLPDSVRRNLGHLVAPGLTSSRWALACVLLGPPITAAGTIWATHEDPRANPPAFVMVGGVVVLACGLIGISSAIKRHRAPGD